MGSPFPGWTTPYLGLNLAPGVSRADAVAALVPFVFQSLRLPPPRAGPTPA